MNGSNAWIFMTVAIVLVSAFSTSLYWASVSGKSAAPRGQWLALVLAVPLAVAGLYVLRGEPGALNSPAAASAHDTAGVNAAVQRLAGRLKEHPDDPDGWVLLARSYTLLERYADAAAAYDHAQARVMRDSGLLTHWIELRLLLGGGKFDARTHQMVERVAALAPDDPDVMLLRALAAFDRGNKAAGDALVGKLRERYPPGTPERQNLDAALEQITPPGAADKP